MKYIKEAPEFPGLLFFGNKITFVYDLKRNPA